MARGDGATTRQMQGACIGAHFVWLNDDLHYPKSLARKINRPDLEIVGPSFFRHDRWRGIRFVEIVVDHAAYLSDETERNVRFASEHSIRNARVDSRGPKP